MGEFTEELLLVDGARTGLCEQFVGRVNGGQNRPAGCVAPNEILNGQAGQPGGGLARRPGAQQGEGVRIVRGKRRQRERCPVGQPSYRQNRHALVGERWQDTRVQHRRLAAPRLANHEREAVDLPQSGQRDDIVRTTEEPGLISLSEGPRTWVWSISALTNHADSLHLRAVPTRQPAAIWASPSAPSLPRGLLR